VELLACAAMLFSCEQTYPHTYDFVLSDIQATRDPNDYVFVEGVVTCHRVGPDDACPLSLHACWMPAAPTGASGTPGASGLVGASGTTGVSGGGTAATTSTVTSCDYRT